MHKTLRTSLLAGAALSLLASAAQAAPNAAEQAQIDQLESELQALNAEVQQLKQTQADSDAGAAVVDLKRSTSDQYKDLSDQIAAQSANQSKVSVDNGRLQITSADGRFSAAVRGLLQYDSAYYMQSHAASLLPSSYGPGFDSGSNFRRVYLGLSGKVFGDWDYNLNFDFGGSGGTETPGHIQSVYLQYDGLAPWQLRIGAFPPPANIEDGTSAGDTIFLERNSPSDLQRNIAGGDGRDAITILYTGDRVFGALSYTGDKVSDGSKALAAAGATAAPVYDDQEALLGRLSWLPVSGPDAHWLVGVNGTYLIKPPQSTINGAANLSTTPGGTAENSITLSDPPELTVDSNGYTLASTSSLDAKHLTQWGVETAGNWENFYGQAGYYGFEVDRAPVAFTTTSGTQIVTPSSDNFSAWYVQGTWIVTGESRNYNPATGAFTAPKVTHPFNFSDGSGWGAFELAARYDDTDLNDQILNSNYVITAASGPSKTYDYYDTVRGGDQRIFTLGLNWYPNDVVHFALNYELIQSSRLQSGSTPNNLTGLTTSTAGTPTIPTLNGGQNIQAVALRAQLAL